MQAYTIHRTGLQLLGFELGASHSHFSPDPSHPISIKRVKNRRRSYHGSLEIESCPVTAFYIYTLQVAMQSPQFRHHEPQRSHSIEFITRISSLSILINSLPDLIIYCAVH